MSTPIEVKYRPCQRVLLVPETTWWLKTRSASRFRERIEDPQPGEFWRVVPRIGGAALVCFTERARWGSEQMFAIALSRELEEPVYYVELTVAGAAIMPIVVGHELERLTDEPIPFLQANGLDLAALEADGYESPPITIPPVSMQTVDWERGRDLDWPVILDDLPEDLIVSYTSTRGSMRLRVDLHMNGQVRVGSWDDVHRVWTARLSAEVAESFADGLRAIDFPGDPPAPGEAFLGARTQAGAARTGSPTAPELATVGERILRSVVFGELDGLALSDLEAPR